DEATGDVRCTVFGPLIEFRRTAETRDFFLRPLLGLHQRRGAGHDDRSDILYPLAATRWQEDYQTFRLLLFTYRTGTRTAPAPSGRATCSGPSTSAARAWCPAPAGSADASICRSSPPSTAPGAACAATASSPTRTPSTSARGSRASARPGRSCFASGGSASATGRSGGSSPSTLGATCAASRRASTPGPPTGENP